MAAWKRPSVSRGAFDLNTAVSGDDLIWLVVPGPFAHLVYKLFSQAVNLLFPHSQLGRPKPLALSDSGLGVRVSIPIALPPPGMRNEAPLPT